MFSTNTAAQISSASYRNPRRRQRPLDDSASPPNAKRQRSLLRDNTFDVHSHKTQNGTQSKFDKEETGDDIPSEEEPIFSGFASLNDIPIRGPKKAENCERINLSSILVNNDFYSVSHVSSLPDKVKEILQGPFRCVISQDAGYCLALTREHAILWAYPLPSASVTADDVHVLSLPRSSTHSSCSSDSLPMGTFTFPSSHSEPGLLVVIPSTGEIVFWETISNPSILGLVKQKQRGLQDSIPGLLSGELTTDIVSIEPAGVILILSTGRLYHVSIRDSQGKPALNFQFLSAQPRATGGGLLKGIRNAFSSNSWRRNIVAARAGRSYRRGQRTLLVATNSGLIEIWDVHWSSGGTLKTHVDSTGAIQEALGTCNILGNGYDYQVVDFTFREAATVCVPESELTESRESLWVLVSVGRDEATSYFVVGVAIQGSRLSADRVYPVHSGTLVKERNPQRTPRLHVPNPGNTGFVVFESGVVLLSLMPFHESPSSQLLLDDEKIPAPFQDFITFREGGGYAVVGCGLEHARIEQKHPSCLAMVRNFGLIRISARPRSISSSGVDEGQIGTQSRLEQVVFYDAKSNPIDLACYEGLSAQPAVLEDAAIQISNDILRSSSRFVPTTVPSLSEQMSSRSAALRALVTYLNRHNVHLSYSAKWTLLSHAEKMAAHMAVWKAQGSILKESASGGTHLDYILGQMGERFKAMPDAGAGEDDLVRHWFIYDTWRMEYIIPWILHGIRDTASDCIRVDRELIRQIWQASELSLAVLETVFRFREENEVLYGLQGCRPDENGPPMPNYSEVAPLWSAGKVNYAETERLLDAQLNTCLQWMRQTGPNPRNSEQPNLTLIERIKQNGPKAFKALWQLYMERVHWCNSQASADEQDSGRALRKHYIDHRKTQLYKMAAMGLLDDSIRLAETLRDMDALVELIVELENQTRDRHPAGVGDPTHDAEMDTFQRRIDKYFQKFGEAWATPFYTRQILSGEAEMLLIRTQYREYVTRFLRARPGYAKLSWMNDILGEKDYASASRSLGEFAANHETNLWSKEVELAIGKLSRLATLESSETQDLSNLQADIRRFDDLSELARTQELLYEHITPAIRGAIDQSAELQLANEQLGKIAVRSKPALREALRRGLAKLVAKCPVEPDELIDILTLMDPISVTEGEDSEIGSHEFSLALKALKLSDLGRHDPGYCEILEKIVWRRCMIRDDWHSINSTKQKGDIEVESAIQSTALFKMLEDIKGFEIQSDTVYQLYAPSDIIDPSIFPHRLASRLLPEQRARLSEDLDEEVGLLRSYIEKDRLGDWFAWIVGAIKDRAAKSVCEH